MNVIKVIEKPWGKEFWIAYDNRRYGGKMLLIEKGKRTSKQYHRFKHETLFVLGGKVEIEMSDGYFILTKHQSMTIPPNTVHRITGKELTMIIEFSSPEMDDVVRLDDDYGRAIK